MEDAKRFIDANKALQMMQDIKSSNPYIFNAKKRGIWELALTCVMARIASCPTVDAVEVVRCKDCKHWHEKTGWCYHHSHFVDSDGGACHPWESSDWKMLNEDDFCSCGERMTDNA